MKVKFILLILLVLILILNFFSQKQNFKSTMVHQMSLVQQEMEDIIGLSHIDAPSNSGKINTHEELKKDKTLNLYSLTKDKVLITLFYDRYNKFSSDFYDDSDEIADLELINLDKEIVDLNNKQLLEASLIDDKISDAKKKFNERHARMIKLKIAFLNEKAKELIEFRQNRSQRFNPWNMFKFYFQYLYHDKPYLNDNLIHLEEVHCPRGEMDGCVKNTSHLIEKTSTTYSFNKLDKSLDPVISNLASTSEDLNLEKKQDIEKRQVEDRIPTLQAPRTEDLIDKLPKLLISFIKPITAVKNEYIQVEYDGIYSMNLQYNPITYHNILHFIQDSLDKHLEITEINDEFINDDDVTAKIKSHCKNFDHKIYYSDLPTPEEATAKASDAGATAESEPQDTEINKSYFKELNSKHLVDPPLYINYKIYKCPRCPMYIKEYI